MLTGKTVERVAILVTRGDPAALQGLLAACNAALAGGREVRILFRDESIPLVCRPESREQLLPAALEQEIGRFARQFHAELTRIGENEEVQMFACTSSLYIWGATREDLLPALAGGRGLIAFLADDVDGAVDVQCF